MNSLVLNLIEQIENIQHGKNWVGSSYASKLSEVDESEMFIRPIDGLHSIAELLSHMTLWREEAIVKIETRKGQKTDDCPENWQKLDQLKAKGWVAIKQQHDQSMAKLIALLGEKNDSFLEQQYYDPDFKGNYTYDWLLNGLLHHDVYHLGQIGLIVKFLKKEQ